MYDGKIFTNKGKLKMKYCGHESFTIRKNWLAKGIRKFDVLKRNELEAMDELGIGKNMVKSLRYWLKVCGLTNDDSKRKIFELSEFGKIVKEKDPYTQEIGTLWLLQYFLATNRDAATTWYYFFNEFNMQEFSADDFVLSLSKWDEMNNSKPAASSSFIKDFDCLKRTYLSRNSEKSVEKKICKEDENDPESNMECPLTELGLLKISDKGLYRKSVPLKHNIPPAIILAVILNQAAGAKEIKLSALQNDKNNIGRVFNLDSMLMISLLSELERRDYVQIVRTAGLDVLRINIDMNFFDCVNTYYEELENE